MQFRKRSCDEGLQNYGHCCAQVQSKTWKRIENRRIFTFKGAHSFLKPFQDARIIALFVMRICGYISSYYTHK